MPAPERVLILALNYAPEPSGNAPYTASLAEYLVRCKDEVQVLTTYPHYPAWQRHDGYRGLRQKERIKGVHVRRLWHWIPQPPRGVRRLLSELLFGARQIVQRWGRAETLVMVSPALFATALCMLRARLLYFRRNRVVWVQDLYFQGMAETGEGGRLAQLLVTGIEGWTLRSAHSVIAIHPTMKQRMTASLGVEASRIQVIPNWTHITAANISKAEARSRLGWSAEQTLVIHAGNMGRKQGLENVVDAAALVAQDEALVFVLLGDGSERDALEARAGRSGGLRFVDPLPAHMFPVALAAADALLVNELPGVKDMAVPSKLTSYLAAGRPLIAAVDPEGPVAGIVRSAGAGTVIPSGEPRALVDAVRGLDGDSDAARRQGSAGRAYWQSHLQAGAALRHLRQAVFPDSTECVDPQFSTESEEGEPST